VLPTANILPRYIFSPVKRIYQIIYFLLLI